MARLDLKNCTIKIRDGSTTPNEVTVKIGEGNLTFTETKEIEYLRDRGTLDEVREGDEQPMSVELQAEIEYFRASTGSATPTPYEAFKNIGEASTWVSSDSDICRPYAVDLVVENVPNCTTGDNETYVFPDFRYESINPDLGAATMSVSGMCNAKAPTITRTAKS